MPIEIKFIGSDLNDIMEQIWSFGGGKPASQEGKDVDTPSEVEQPRKTRQRAPIATPEPIQEVSEEAEKLIEGALTPKGLLELKNRMLPTLQGAIAEGKIDQLRALLAAEGGGAKSFPEVDVKYFPAIEKAVQNGALK